MNEQEHILATKDVNLAVFYLKNRYMEEDERKAEDLNDKKAAWLSVALEKGIKNLNSREIEFAEQYIRENVHYSLHFMYKEWLTKFIEQQRVRYGLK